MCIIIKNRDDRQPTSNKMCDNVIDTNFNHSSAKGVPDGDSNSETANADCADAVLALRLKAMGKKRITLCKDIMGLSRDDLKLLIHKKSHELYDNEAKEEQVDAVASLVHSRHTFVLAGTGFGKTRIAEMHHDLFQPYQKSITIVLNPLDSLGDNQVSNKTVLHCKRNKSLIVVT